MPVHLPTIIQGPAIVIFNSQSFYFRDGLKRSIKRETFDVSTDAHGVIDKRVKSAQVELTGTPDGQLISNAVLAKYFPYAVGDVGKSIFGASDKSLVIHTLAGQTITYARAAITKLPVLRLKPTDTVFGDMAWTCLGKSATQPTEAGYFSALASAAFADATFNADAIRTARYQAAWGADAPYDVMGAKEGFELEIAIETSPITVDDFGVVDMILKSITGLARFAPTNLTEAEVDDLLAIQDADAVLPGQSLAKANKDLVIAADGVFSATLHKCGPMDMDSQFQTGEHRHGQLQFQAKRTWTSGSANALWTFDVE